MMVVFLILWIGWMLYFIGQICWSVHRQKKFNALLDRCPEIRKQMIAAETEEELQAALAEHELLLEAAGRCTKDIWVWSPLEWKRKWNRDYFYEAWTEKMREEQDEHQVR